ncbi:hypothetical protein RRF57_003980 [Xylaria bambusicola]|uniref:Uncharacterized protein n=1 Tax=Xylaria bambusicola TaxID=326684 RepID=A0AAN7YWR5_9PEZI
MNGHAPVQNHGLPMKSEFDDTAADVGLRGRITDFTFANFTCTQSTGAVVIMLSETPHQFHGLQTIGVIIFIFNIVVFLCFCAVMLTRFILHPHMLKKSVTTPPECFFIGSFWLSMATVIMSMQQFGVPHTGFWVVVAIRVLFWMYAAVTLIYATAMFTMLYLKSILTPSQIQPAMFISVYNTMLTGTIAAFIARSQPPAARLPIIVAGVAYQGLGCAQYLPPSYDYFARCHPLMGRMVTVCRLVGDSLLFTFRLLPNCLLVTPDSIPENWSPLSRQPTHEL